MKTLTPVGATGGGTNVCGTFTKFTTPMSTTFFPCLPPVYVNSISAWCSSVPSESFRMGLSLGDIVHEKFPCESTTPSFTFRMFR